MDPRMKALLVTVKRALQMIVAGIDTALQDD
jgi:hypothetical protein